MPARMGGPISRARGTKFLKSSAFLTANAAACEDIVMAQAANQRPQYVDRPDLPETFADSVKYVTFDGATVRVELCVTRVEDGASAAARSSRRYPVSRLVLRPDAAVDLFIQLQRLIATMEQRGIIKRQAPAKPAGADAATSLQNPLGTNEKH